MAATTTRPMMGGHHHQQQQQRPASGRVAASAPEPKTGTQMLLETLTRLNDKSTQRMAADELEDVVQRLEPDGVTPFISNICSARTWEPKPFARKECVRAVGLLAAASCPVHELVLQHHLGKLLTYLRKHMQDVDAAVRDAACQALVSIASSQVASAGARLPGSLGVPVVRVVFDCLGEQKKEAQSAAGQALLQVSPYLASVDAELVKVLLRLLRSATFQGAAALLAALASTDADGQRPVGLCKECAASLLPFLPRLIGQPGAPSGAGVLGCFDSKDWAVRRAAGDALRALALLFGPHWEQQGTWDVAHPGSITGDCLQVLERARFDKVKEARDAAREALGVVQELVAYMQQGGDVAGWGDYGAPARSASPGGSCSPAGSRPASSRGLDRRCSVAERFHRAATPADLVAGDGADAGGEGRRRSSASAGDGGVCVEEQGAEAEEGDGGGAPDGPGQRKAGAAPAGGPQRSPSKRLSGGGSGGAGRLSQQGSSAGGEEPLIKAHYGGDSHPAIDAQPSLDQGRAGQAAPDRSGTSSRRTSAGAPQGAPAPAAAEQQQAAPPGTVTVTVSAQEWQQLQAQVSALRQQQHDQAALMAAMTERFECAVARLQARVQELQQQQQQQQQQGPGSSGGGGGGAGGVGRPSDGSSSGRSGSRRSLGVGGLSRSADGGLAQEARRLSLAELHHQGVSSSLGSVGTAQQTPGASAGGLGDSASPLGSPPVDLQGAYSAALAGGKGDMHLLRLIQRTGPVWDQLRGDTALALLRTFIQHVQEGVMLHRVLPWLWRLADADARHRPQLPQAEQQQLLLALEACPAAEDVQVQEKIALLVSTLKAVWSPGGGPN